jgi:hypothetical protein
MDPGSGQPPVRPGSARAGAATIAANVAASHNDTHLRPSRVLREV